MKFAIVDSKEIDKEIAVDLQSKKIALIEWLVRVQDEELINRIDTIRKNSVDESYNQQMPASEAQLESKMDLAARQIVEGRIHAQEAVEKYLEGRFKQ